MSLICIIVSVTNCTCVLIGCTPQLRCRSPPRCCRPDPVFRSCWPGFTGLLPYATVTWPLLCSNSGAILRHFQVRFCWIKIDSAVNLGETPSSEFVQCVLWVIRLTKTVESIYCAVRHSVTLPRAVWRTIRWPHSVQVLIATTTDAGRHRPSAARPTMPAVRFVGVAYYAVFTTRLLPALAVCRWLHLFGDIFSLILCYGLPFPCFTF